MRAKAILTEEVDHPLIREDGDAKSLSDSVTALAQEIDTLFQDDYTKWERVVQLNRDFLEKRIDSYKLCVELFQLLDSEKDIVQKFRSIVGSGAPQLKNRVDTQRACLERIPEAELAKYRSICALPSVVEDIQYKALQTVDVNSPTAVQDIQHLRKIGYPFILVGHNGFHKFSSTWANADGGLNVDAFLDVLEHETVPVIQKDYNPYHPIREHRKLGDFVRNHWLQGDSSVYMHQWQFPLSPGAAQVLCRQSTPLHCIGDNILKHWLDICRFENPMQYLFMGSGGTRSKIHKDCGGLDIMVSCIVGEKEIIMVHRDDDDKLSGLEDLDTADLEHYPLLVFATMWKHQLKPGEILYMPDGTFHSVKNRTPCLSYHCLHLDSTNLINFYKSMRTDDAPEIDHAEVIWNAAHDLMKSLDTYSRKNCPTAAQQEVSQRFLINLQAIQQVIRAMKLNEVPNVSLDDLILLSTDIDDSIERFVGSPVAKPVATVSRSSSADEETATNKQRALIMRQTAAAEAAWSNLSLKVNDRVVVRCYLGQLTAKVLELSYNADVAKIHYVGWPRYYDEFQPIQNILFEEDKGRRRKRPVDSLVNKLKNTEVIQVKWKGDGKVYDANVLYVCRQCVAFVEYLMHSEGLRQWVSLSDISAKLQ